MANGRIAVLFDAENINRHTAQRVLDLLTAQGEVPIRRAVGDFSAATLTAWVAFARDNGIELVMQPCLGKGKNGADIRLTIEAMDIVHTCRVDTIALVTHDRDFTPLALRLRHADLTVLGFAQTEPHPSFRHACSGFAVICRPPAVPAERLAALPEAKPVAAKPQQVAVRTILDPSAVARLLHVAILACQNGPISPANLRKALLDSESELTARIGGNGKFLKTLVAHNIVERVGSGPDLMVRATRPGPVRQTA